LQVVRGDDDRLDAALGFPEHARHLAATLQVETPRRFVEQDELRVHREYAGECDEVLLPADDRSKPSDGNA